MVIACIFYRADQLNGIWTEWNLAEYRGERTYVCFSNVHPHSLCSLGREDWRISLRKTWNVFDVSKGKLRSLWFWPSNSRSACHEKQHPTWAIVYVNITFRVICCATTYSWYSTALMCNRCVLLSRLFEFPRWSGYKMKSCGLQWYRSIITRRNIIVHFAICAAPTIVPYCLRVQTRCREILSIDVEQYLFAIRILRKR